MINNILELNKRLYHAGIYDFQLKWEDSKYSNYIAITVKASIKFDYLEHTFYKDLVTIEGVDKSSSWLEFLPRVGNYEQSECHFVLHFTKS